MNRLLISLICLLGSYPLAALEKQPWLGDIFEFHFLGSYYYSRFNSFQDSIPPMHSTFQANVIDLGLDFSPSPVWSIDGDFQLADTTAQSFNFRTMALQARYLWADDIIGDPVSFVTGFSTRFTASHALKDISCPSHGNLDFELNFSLGKEFDASDLLRFRLWCFGAVGHANRGAPWVRAIVALESNYDEIHKWALYAEGINGYGRHVHVDIDHFDGYAKVREKAIDVAIRYGHRVGVWGTLRFEYIRRVLAKSAPSNVNTFMVSYLLPFSL
jgi:hypothetical protein